MRPILRTQTNFAVPGGEPISPTEEEDAVTALRDYVHESTRGNNESIRKEAQIESVKYTAV